MIKSDGIHGYFPPLIFILLKFSFDVRTIKIHSNGDSDGKKARIIKKTRQYGISFM